MRRATWSRAVCVVDFLVKHNGRNIDTIRTWHIVKTSFLQSCLAAFFFYVLWICLAMCLFYLKRVFCVHFLWRGSFFSLFAVSVVSDRQSMYGALRDLVPFVQYKKSEKHPWRSFTLKVTLLHGCFSRFSSCTNGTKSRKASRIQTVYLLHSFLFISVNHVSVMCQS